MVQNVKVEDILIDNESVLSKEGKELIRVVNVVVRIDENLDTVHVKVNRI